MHGIYEINAMNAEKTKTAKRKKLLPYRAKQNGDPEVFNMPDIGDYVPTGFKLVETLFVDHSGFGTAGEPALTADQFLKKVKSGMYYAIVEQGQFQLYVGVFKIK